VDESVPGSANSVSAPAPAEPSPPLLGASVGPTAHAAGPLGPALYFSVWPRASAGMRSSTWCEKKRPQFATSSLPGPLTASESAPSVRLAPSTERPRLRVSPRGSRFGGGQSEDRTKASPARCISVWTDLERHGRSRSPRSRVANCRLFANCANFRSSALDPDARACIESGCTEYGASEVDGSPSGSRFGGGQSESRTKAPPARCISLSALFLRPCVAARQSLKAAALVQRRVSR